MYQEDLGKEEKHDLASLFVLFKYAKGHTYYLIFSLCMVLVSSALLMISAKTLGNLVEVLRSPASGYSPILKFTIIIVICELTFVIVRYTGSYGLYFVTNKIVLQIRRHLFEKITLLPVKYFDGQPIGRTITRLTNDVEGIQTFFSGTLSKFVNACINIIAVFVAMMLTDFRFGLAIVATSLPALAFVFFTREPEIGRASCRERV